MKVIGPKMAVILSLALAGCAASEPRFDTAPDGQANAGRTLLFDARPGDYSAADIAYGADWPSALSQFQRTEHLRYSESIHDIQGRLPTSRDFTYRRFRLEREGYATR